MNPRPAGSHRDLLDRLEREHARLHGEEEDALDAEAEAFANRAEKELRADPRGLVPGDAVLAILPANADPLAPQDPSRKAQFIRHLAAMAEGAILDRDRLEVEPAPADVVDAVPSLACAACRGSCCRGGGDHAYLTEETLARLLEARPGWTLAQILDAYLEHLPAETTRDSCIFHGARACGLPRDLRSVTCNTYECGKLAGLRSRLPLQDAPPVLALLFDRGRWARSALLDAKGVRILAEEPPAPP